MKVEQLMTPDPVCCAPHTRIAEVAQLMAARDCGAVPVLDPRTRHPVGILTDRDIVVRIVAMEMDPRRLRAEDCMSLPVVSVPRDASLERCAATMEANRIRRVCVVDSDGRCVGIVAQADVAGKLPPQAVAHLLETVSHPFRLSDLPGPGPAP